MSDAVYEELLKQGKIFGLNLSIKSANLKHDFLIAHDNNEGVRLGVSATPAKNLVVAHLEKDADDGEWMFGFTFNGFYGRNPYDKANPEALPNREVVAALSRVERMLQSLVKDLPDSEVITGTPYTGDGAGSQRLKLYKRFGFKSVYETDLIATTVGEIKRRSRRNDALPTLAH